MARRRQSLEMWFLITMSEETFGDRIEDALGDRRNTNQMLYALASSSQRQAQLRSMEGQREAQGRLAATEEARLKIEQRRLDLEVARGEAAKAEAEAVKVLRRLLAQTGSDLQTIRQQAGLPA
jgi:hypothetical protein